MAQSPLRGIVIAQISVAIQVVRDRITSRRIPTIVTELFGSASRKGYEEWPVIISRSARPFRKGASFCTRWNSVELDKSVARSSEHKLTNCSLGRSPAGSSRLPTSWHYFVRSLGTRSVPPYSESDAIALMDNYFYFLEYETNGNFWYNFDGRPKSAIGA